VTYVRETLALVLSRDARETLQSLPGIAAVSPPEE